MRPESDPAEVAEAVRRCRADRAFLEALGEIYRQVDAATAAEGCDCRGCGRCCRFDLMDHRLYASAGEIAYLLECEVPRNGARGELRCPYHVEPHCFARRGRALGCRCYFCYPPGAVERGRETYERFHRKIQELHDAHGLAYVYVELTGALRAMGG